MKRTAILTTCTLLLLATGCDARREPVNPAVAPEETATSLGADASPSLGPILVTAPSIGARVSSPVTVAGEADVFEATLQMRLLDADGQRLARAFTTATCGTGCRGDFSHDLSFTTDGAQRGVVEVWWSSPEDGSRRDVVKIPVTLVP